MAVDVRTLFDEAVDACTYGWDQAIHGLLLLGFTLMDSYKLDANPSACPSPAHNVRLFARLPAALVFFCIAPSRQISPVCRGNIKG